MAATLALEVLDRIFGYLEDVEATPSDNNPAPRASPAKQVPQKRFEGLPGDVFEGIKLCDSAPRSSVDVRRERDNIQEVHDTLAAAARVNKHWLVAARRSLYLKLKLTSWDSLVLLSETLQFWNPNLRDLIREISSLKLDELASSSVPIQRIFSSLPNLRSLDANNIIMRVEDRYLPSLQKLFISHHNFRTKLKEPPKDCTCTGCYSPAVPKAITSPESSLKILAAFPSASFVYLSHARFHRDLGASCINQKPLPKTSRLPIPTLALGPLSPVDHPLPALKHLCLDLPVFDLDHVSLLFTPIACSLRHLKLVHPKFSTTGYHPYEDAGITAILQAVGQDLITFHCAITNTIGSTAFRCLKNVKDLRYSAIGGRLQTDVVDALPHTIERLDLRWDESDEFMHFLLSRLQEPEFLPSLKFTPYLRRVRLDYVGSLEESLKVRVAAARSHMLSRGLCISDPSFANSLLAVVAPRTVPDFIPPYFYDYDDYDNPYGTPPSDEDEDASDYGFF